MSELTVEMLLSLVDNATPKLDKFRDALKASADSAQRTSDEVNKFQDVIDKSAASTEKFAASIKSMGSGFRTTANAMGKIIKYTDDFLSSLQRAGITVGEFSNRLAVLSVNAKGAADALNLSKKSAREAGTAFTYTFRSLNRLAASADSNTRVLGRLRDALVGVADGATDVAGHAAVAAHGMDEIGQSARRTTEEVSVLSSGMKGLVELWAGFKIEGGLRSSVDQASKFATQIAQLRELGFSNQSVQYAKQQAWNTAAQTPFASVNTALASRRAIVAATGVNDAALQNEVLPQLLQNAYIYKNALASPLSISDIVKNFATLAEARGMSQTAQGLIDASNQALQVSLGTQGRIKLTTQEVVARQTKYGGAQLQDKSGYFNQMAVAEQYMTQGREQGSGGGGRGVSTVGTSVSMVLKTMLGGKMNKVTYALLEKMGMIEAGGTTVVPGSKTTTTDKNALITLLGSTQGEKNTIGWLHDVLAPRMLAYVKAHKDQYFTPGANINSQDAQRLAMDRLAVQLFGPTGGINVGNMAFMAANPGTYARIQNSSNLMEHSVVGSAGMANVNKYKLAVDNFTGALNTLKVAIGTGLLPVLTPLISMLAKIITDVGRFAHEAPVLTAALTALGVAFGGLLIVRGFTAMFGSLRDVMTLLSVAARGTAGSMAAAGTAAKVAGAEAASSVPGWLLVNRSLLGVEATATASPAIFARMSVAWGAAMTRMAAVGRAAAASIGAIFSKLFVWLTVAFGLWEVMGAFKVGGYNLQQEAKVMAIAIYNEFAWAFNKIAEGFYWLASVNQSAASWVTGGGWTAKSKTWGGKQESAQEASAKIYAQARQLWVDHILNPKTIPAPPPMASIEDAAFKALNQAADATSLPSSGGFGGGGKATKGKKGGKSALDKEAEAQQKALDHLYALADAAAKKADAINAKMNEAAQKLYASYNALMDPEGYKIGMIKQKYGALAAQMTQYGHPMAAHFANVLGSNAVKAEEFKRHQQELTLAKSQMETQIANNANLVKAGAMTKMEAGQADIAVQKQSAGQMIKLLQEMIALKEASAGYAHNLKDQQIVASLEQQISAARAMQQQLGYYSAKVKETMQSSFTGLFENIMHGQKTWGQMFYSFFSSIGKGIEDTLAKSISQAITTSLFGKKSNQGIGSIIGGIAHWVGNLFGGSGSKATGVGAVGGGGGSSFGSIVSTGASIFKDIGMIFGSFAVGADNIPRDMVAQIHKGEMIIPAAGAHAIRTGQASIGGAPGGNHLHLTVHAMDSQSVIGALHSVRQEAAQMFLNTASDLNLAPGG